MNVSDGRVVSAQNTRVHDCDERLDTTAARHRCEQAGHTIDVRETPVWWIRYRADGRTRCVSAHAADRDVADALLRTLERPTIDAATPAAGRPSQAAGSFAAAAEALLGDYRMNGKKSL